MSLFNEYENKNLQFILYYINRFNMGNIDPIDEEAFRKELGGGDLKLTSPELIDALLNANEEENQNLYILYADENNDIVPLLNSDDLLPSFISAAERSWIYMVLNDPKADLFINPGVKQVIMSLLSDNHLLDINKYVYTTNVCKKEKYAPEYIKIFKTLMSHIKMHAYVEITLNGNDIDILPFRMIYHQSDDSFSVLAMSQETNDLIIIDLNEIIFAENSALGIYNSPDKSWNDLLSEILARHKVTEPITVEILNSDSFTKQSNMADDRFNHLFSHYITRNYENENGNLVSEINYYDFQYYEVIEKILSLGKYVKVIGPETVKEEIINILRAKEKNIDKK